MLIKLPEEVPYKAAVAVGLLIAAAQVIEGTAIYVSLLCFVFLMLSVLAFNISGGLKYGSGSFVFFCSLLTLMVGVVVKVFLGEPFERNLIAPEQSLIVYVAGMATVTAAAFFNAMVRPKRAVLDEFSRWSSATNIGIGCLMLAILPPLIIPAKFMGTFVQANYFFYLSILIPVYDRVRRTNGAKSFNYPALIGWAYLTVNGLLSFSKQGIFAPSFTWAVAALAAGVQVSIKKMVLILGLTVFLVTILTPYSQLGRNLGRQPSILDALDVSVALLAHPLELREYYETQTAYDRTLGEVDYHMFDSPQGILDRLNMFAIDDALINKTNQGTKSDLSAIWSYFESLVPRYLYPDKPVIHWGNTYAHEIGMLGAEDESTGISFSSFADAYHCDQWMGVTIISFPIYLIAFYLMDAVGGSSDRSIWALLYLIYNAHSAPEGMLGGPLYGGITVSFFLILCGYAVTRIIPALAVLAGASSSPSTPAGYVTQSHNVQSA